MREKQIIRILREADENAVERLSMEHPGLNDADKARLFARISENLQHDPDFSDEAEVSDPEPAVHESRLIRLMPVLSAAACLLVVVGTVAGLGVMQNTMKPPAQQIDTTDFTSQPTTESTSLSIIRGYNMNEQYAVANLTDRGELYLTVTDAVQDDDICIVTIQLEYEGSDAEMLFADNFLLATDGFDDPEITTVSPCAMDTDAQEGKAPYSFTVQPGRQYTLELQYQTEGNGLHLTTGTDEFLPYTEILTEGVS